MLASTLDTGWLEAGWMAGLMARRRPGQPARLPGGLPVCLSASQATYSTLRCTVPCCSIQYCSSTSLCSESFGAFSTDPTVTPCLSIHTIRGFGTVHMCKITNNCNWRRYFVRSLPPFLLPSFSYMVTHSSAGTRGRVVMQGGVLRQISVRYLDI